MYVVHHNALLDSFRIRISFFKNRIVKIHYPIISDMSTLVRKHFSIDSILFDSSKHPYKTFARLLESFDWLLHRH